MIVQQFFHFHGCLYIPPPDIPEHTHTAPIIVALMHFCAVACQESPTAGSHSLSLLIFPKRA